MNSTFKIYLLPLLSVSIFTNFLFAQQSSNHYRTSLTGTLYSGSVLSTDNTIMSGAIPWYEGSFTKSLHYKSISTTGAGIDFSKDSGSVNMVSENGLKLSIVQSYPNPSGNLFNIRVYSENLFHTSELVIEIFSMDGRLLQTSKTNAIRHEVTMPISLVAPTGIYFIMVKTNNGFVVTKHLLQNDL